MRPTNEHVRSDIQEEKFRIRSLSDQGGRGYGRDRRYQIDGKRKGVDRSYVRRKLGERREEWEVVSSV